MSQRRKKTRQPFNVIMGALGIVLTIAIAVGTYPDSWPGGLFFAAVLGIVSYLFMLRPHLRVQEDKLIVSNVVREVHLPWESISHATSRGSLTIHDIAGHKTTAWAIGAQKAKVTRDADQDPTDRSGFRPTSSNDLRAPATSAGALKEAINAECIDNEPGESQRTVRWLPVETALAVLAVFALVAGIFA